MGLLFGIGIGAGLAAVAGLRASVPLVGMVLPFLALLLVALMLTFLSRAGRPREGRDLYAGEL